MLLLFSLPYNDAKVKESPEFQQLLELYKYGMFGRPHDKKHFIEVMSQRFYLEDLKQDILNNLTYVFIVPFQYTAIAHVNRRVHTYDSSYISDIKREFPSFKPFSESTWTEIIIKTRSEKIFFLSIILESSIAKKLLDIPVKNLHLIIDHWRVKYEYPTDVLNFTLEFAKSQKNCRKDKIDPYVRDILDLFQVGHTIAGLPYDGFVLRVNTNDFDLAKFLIKTYYRRIYEDSKIFWYDGNEDLEKFNNEYEVLVVTNFDCIGFQRQNNFWKIVKGLVADKKQVFLVGKNAHIIPIIKDDPIFIDTVPFEFNNLVEDENVVRFLCYFYYHTDEFGEQFRDYWDIPDNFHRGIFFQATSFNILLKAMEKLELYSSVDFYDPLFLYRLQLQITKLNKIEKIGQDKSPVKKSKNEYIWKFRGNYWEISFKYPESILVEDVQGIFFIGKFLKNAGVKINISKLKQESGLSEKDSNTTTLNSLRNQLDKAIIKIENIEKQYGSGNDLSKYLKHIINRRGFIQDEQFCTWPSDRKIKWNVFAPEKYFIKERGTHNPSGKRGKNLPK